MRVALVTPDLDPGSGGPARSVPRLAEALATAGADVELHYLGPGGSRPGNPRYEPHRRGFPARLGRSAGLRAALAGAAVDVIHANCLWMRPLHYAAQASRRLATPLVVSPRGMLAPWARRSRWLLKQLASRLVHPGALDLAAGIHATSRLERDELRQFGIVQPICVAPNGIDPPAGDSDSDAARRHYLAADPRLEGRRVLLFHSRFHAKKRVRELLDDFARLAGAHPDWHLLLVGIPEQYGVRDLQRRARELGVADRVSVLDGRGRPHPYVVAELMVLPTHSENFGMVVAEALVAGLPVVTTRGTPWAELDAVGAGACVSLDQVGACLSRWMRQPSAELRAAGDRGRRFVLAEFSWDVAAARLLEFYAELGRSRSLNSSAFNTLSNS